MSTATAPTYYARNAGNLFELRQTRFKAQFEAGNEHPHDVCAYAYSAPELLGMYHRLLSGGVDWSAAFEPLPIGCLFDGSHGAEYNESRVVALAKQYGWEGEKATFDAEEWELYSTEITDDATEYLQQFAPEGHTVGWNDGDFGTWPDEDDINDTIEQALAAIDHNAPPAGLLSIGGQLAFSPPIQMHDEAIEYVFVTDNGHAFARTSRQKSQLVTSLPLTLRQEIVKRLTPQE